ncbi:LysR family transcriptional regulator [bacterium]|nr:LysR family transcriptional regulator [bacterium]
MNLHEYDLNLLAIFDMIFTERHLTKAGEKLKMSQPAMSQALKRLRDTFQDQLFVRSGKELIPTTCAIRIAPQVKQIISLAKNTFFDRGEFDPANSSRTFRLAMSDYTEMIVMPKLFKRLQEYAPKIRLESKHLSPNDYKNVLEGDDLDIILGCSLQFGANIYQQALFEDEEVLIVRNDSPVLKAELTLERYITLKHAQFQWFEEINMIDRELKSHNLERNIVLEVQHEMVLPLVLKDNEIVVNMPRRMAKVFKEFLPLEVLDLPFKVNKYFVCQYWHERNHLDPAIKWLRSEIKQIAEYF